MTTGTEAAESAQARLVAALAPVACITDRASVKLKSRDFYWYSPILKAQLRDMTADVVAVPRDEAEVIHVARSCAALGVPITVRGAGTGNYGQAMPLKRGVVLEMTALDRIKWLKPGVVRVEAGKKLIDLEAETVPQGWELRFHPSTRRTATIGGFVAGGSGGVGSINYGGLRERGNVAALRLVTMEREPQIVELRGDEVQQAIHAYGTNGIITELEVALAPAWKWVDLIVACPDIMAAMRFGQALAEADAIVKKLITPIEWSAAQYFKPLKDHLPHGQAICIAMIAEPSLEPFRLLAAQAGGTICYQRGPNDAGSEVPPLYEFTWNHTTLHALKADRTITYLQTRYPGPDHIAAIAKLKALFGDEVPIHCEVVRESGHIAWIGLQLVRFTTPERLAEIIRIHEDHGCLIFNPHTCILEDGGMKTINEHQLAFKRRADPLGLMNPGKMRAWEERTR
jgi:FAD/FMN-containing dehydrogenase